MFYADLIAANKTGVTDALQLCTLLLPQSNRSRLHHMLRFLYKASSNSQLVLSRGELTRDVLLRHFASTIVRSSSKVSRVELAERRKVETLVMFMAQHYQHIFKVSVCVYGCLSSLYWDCNYVISVLCEC